MCNWLVLFLLGISLTSLAELRPLTMKDVGLMIRSGSSSQNLLEELARRGVSERLDDQTRKALVEFHASPQLLASLAAGSFLTSADAAERARLAAAQEAERRLAETTQIYRNAAVIQWAENAREATAAQESTGPPLAEGLKGKLVVSREGAIRPADDVDFAGKKLIALYFSANWSGPSRQFTPQLADFFRQKAPQHPEFEIVFVSRDHSRFNWETYLRETGMPWPAIDFEQATLRDNLAKVGGESIPALVLVDATGRIIASSYDGKKFLGPQNVLNVLNQIWAGATPVR